MAVFTDFEILVGTYEEYVIGYKLVPQIKPSINYDLVQNFVVNKNSEISRTVGNVKVFVGRRFSVKKRK